MRKFTRLSIAAVALGAIGVLLNDLGTALQNLGGVL
jgi:hypothetical protein